MMSRRSEVFLTGKNLDLGTLMPRQLSKHFMAAPTAVYMNKFFFSIGHYLVGPRTLPFKVAVKGETLAMS